MINLLETGRILYISSVDISIGNGPGVNENEFILALHSMIGDRAHFLIPRPEQKITGLPADSFTFSLPHKRHNPIRYLGHILSQMRIADQLLSQRQFDLLLFRLDILPIMPFYITRKHPIPYAIKTLGQGLVNSLGERGGWLGKSLMGLNRWLVNELLSGALLADSVSKAQVAYLESLLDAHDQKILWIDNAVNTERFYPASSENTREKLGLSEFDPIVGYVGTRPWERGGMQLVEMASRLLEKYPRLGLIILGDGNGLNDLKQRADELQIQKHCVFTGYVPFPEVPLYVNSLDVGVSISLHPERYAASELKVRQYLACGKPVVVSPGSNDFVANENFGSIVPPTDLDTITTELDHWLSISHKERQDFSDRASQYMRDNLSIQSAVNRRLELYSNKLDISLD